MTRFTVKHLLVLTTGLSVLLTVAVLFPSETLVVVWLLVAGTLGVLGVGVIFITALVIALSAGNWAASVFGIKTCSEKLDTASPQIDSAFAGGGKRR